MSPHQRQHRPLSVMETGLHHPDAPFRMDTFTPQVGKKVVGWQLWAARPHRELPWLTPLSGAPQIELLVNMEAQSPVPLLQRRTTLRAISASEFHRGLAETLALPSPPPRPPASLPRTQRY